MDHSHSVSNYYLQLAFEKNTAKRAFRTAIIVGLILNFINHTQAFITLSFNNINLFMVLLTFMVPYLVSTFSSVAANSSLKTGKISNIDGMLQCNNCKMVDFKASIGEEIEECPNCKKKTSWKILTLSSFTKRDNDMMKSLALFARHNPEPLFRVDEKGIITGANPASEILFEKESLSGDNIKILFPELSDIDIFELISKREKKNITVIVKDRIFDLTLKGVASISTMNVYGNEITQIVMAEHKIKEQAKNISDSIVYASRIQVAMLPEEASGRLKEIYDDIIEKRGKLADVHKIQSLRPESIIKHMDLYLEIMFSKSELSRSERELMAVVVSVNNGCEYCILHHSEALNHYWKDHDRIELFVSDFGNAALNEREKLLCNFAEKLTCSPGQFNNDSSVNKLKEKGLNDSAILDATLVVSYFNFVNRVVLALGVETNDVERQGYKF